MAAAALDSRATEVWGIDFKPTSPEPMPTLLVGVCMLSLMFVRVTADSSAVSKSLAVGSGAVGDEKGHPVGGQVDSGRIPVPSASTLQPSTALAHAARASPRAAGVSDGETLGKRYEAWSRFDEVSVPAMALRDRYGRFGGGCLLTNV